MTGFGAAYPLILDACILVVAGAFTIIPPYPVDSLPSSRPSSPHLRPTSPAPQIDGQQSEVKDHLQTKDQIPALTIYRSHMLLMTFLAILAVDFPIFPRNLAKCETFGVSLVCLF